MDRMVAYCGLACGVCGAYVATVNNDDEKRREVAAQWTEEYNHDFTAQDINCLGCTSDGKVVFSYCNSCEIRKCARAKGVENCAYCDDYACERLAQFFESVPEAKKQLDAIRASL